MDSTVDDEPSMTANQLRVLELDRQGVKPKRMAEQLGMSLSGVHQIRQGLRRAGHAIAVHQICGPGKKSGRPKRAVDDETDSDEPYGPWRYCRCGLRMNCNACVTIESVAFSNPGGANPANYAQDVSDASIATDRWQKSNAKRRERIAKQG